MLTFNWRCYFCRQRLYLPAHGICCVCLTRLPPLPPCCPQCGLPADGDSEICRRCLLEPPPWQALVAVGDYQTPLKELLIQLKFRRHTELVAVLARLFTLRWRARRRSRPLVKPDLLISVPLHKQRQWRRGFNQTDLIAARLSHYLACSWSPSTVERVRATPAQQTLTAAERRRNLCRAFSLRASVAGANVAVFDDVVTTGSTLAEIARLLLANGARTVQAWCICRTLLADE